MAAAVFPRLYVHLLVLLSRTGKNPRVQAVFRRLYLRDHLNGIDFRYNEFLFRQFRELQSHLRLFGSPVRHSTLVVLECNVHPDWLRPEREHSGSQKESQRFLK